MKPNRRQVIRNIGTGLLSIGALSQGVSAQATDAPHPSNKRAKRILSEKYGKKAANKALPIIHSEHTKLQKNPNIDGNDFQVRTLDRLYKHKETEPIAEDYVNTSLKIHDESFTMDVDQRIINKYTNKRGGE